MKTKTRNKLSTQMVNGTLLASQCVKESGTCVKFTPTKAMLQRMKSNILYPSKENVTDLEDAEEEERLVIY